MGGSEEKKRQKKLKKTSKKKKGSGQESEGAPPPPQVITDDRFASAQTDPRFLEAPKKRSKVPIDSRFRHVFTHNSFTSSNASVDKRGKPNNNNKAAISLKHYYRLQQQPDDNDNEIQNDNSPVEEDDQSDSDVERDQIGRQTESETETSSETLEDDDDDVESLDGSSSTSTTDSDDQYMDEEEEDTFMQLEDNVPEIDEETRRLAVVNLDWSQVRFFIETLLSKNSGFGYVVSMGNEIEHGGLWDDLDIMALLKCLEHLIAFCSGALEIVLVVKATEIPPNNELRGQILSVAVYPSEFGLKRMEAEAIHGPIGLYDDDDEKDDDDGEDDEIDNKKLRAYELSRLRYYYAVVECDSSATADYLSKTCDGLEFERSANKLDLRFIPDSMDFKHQPRDVATEAPADYEGLDFQTRALQHSNIHLTWDEDEPQRAKMFKRKLNDEQLAQLELKEILASDESETDDDKKPDKYRALLPLGGGSDEDHEEDSLQDMEVTFNSGLEDISKRILEKKDKKSETVWEAYLRKRKEKRKASKNRSKYSSDSEEKSSDTDQELAEPDDFFVEEPSTMESRGNPVQSTKKRKSSEETIREAEASRAELELLTADDNGEDANLKGYNLKPKKSKGKKGKGIPDEGKIPAADYADPRFSALFTSPLFALDPTDPQFKRSAAYARQVTKKQKTDEQESVGQMDQGENATSDGLAKRKEKNELSALVRSIKMKSKEVALPSQGKVARKHKHLQYKEKMKK
ncbi:Pre-rRNA-processing protein esf1 [Sesamum angolense]|uniref:Pre-rRNA-processing protein esf1 n=1 Tax=Sesamum angolense TaxID=2727404 RepID=A0AAE1WJ40_9LAMI|nr:Pre-rRNA-processing protein esf1 [Sesamum angolense]